MLALGPWILSSLFFLLLMHNTTLESFLMSPGYFSINLTSGFINWHQALWLCFNYLFTCFPFVSINEPMVLEFSNVCMLGDWQTIMVVPSCTYMFLLICGNYYFTTFSASVSPCSSAPFTFCKGKQVQISLISCSTGVPCSLNLSKIQFASLSFWIDTVGFFFR